MSRESILAEVSAERDYQDEKWGGPEVDDRENGPFEWLTYICNYATKWFPGGFPPYSKETQVSYRDGLIKVAALAVAAVEQYDRKGGI